MYDCHWYWNGSDWQMIAGFCATGKHCEKPTGAGNPGEQRGTNCVDD